MLKFAEKDNNLNQISLTGARAIIIIGLLSIAPRTFDEIKAVFVEHGYMEKDSPDDILRIDLNTIKSVGYEITRACKSTNYKYIIKKHPYSLPVTKDDYKILKRVYERIKYNVSLNRLIEYDELFRKIASFIYDEELHQAFLGISILKHYKKDLIHELMIDCDSKNTIKILYKTISSNKISIKEIVADKLALNNDKIYLYGYDTQKKANVTLNLNRIMSIQSRDLVKRGDLAKPVKIKFLLNNNNINSLVLGEDIIEANDKGFLVHGKYFNEFTAIQRVLSFGSDCTVIEPVEFKNTIISKLKEMRNLYEK